MRKRKKTGINGEKPCERHNKTIRHSAETHGQTFEQLLEIARVLRAYMLWEDQRDKTPFSKGMCGMASSLIGIRLGINRKTGKICWRLAGKDIKRHQKRLRSAGIDPDSWEIMDAKRAAWAWWQLKQEGHYYSEKRQAQLMSGINGEPPDINIALKYSQHLEKIQDVLSEQLAQRYKLPADIRSAIKERLG